MNEFLNELTSIASDYDVTVKQSFESKECNEYEFFDKFNRKICYVIEHFYSPCDFFQNEPIKLEHTVYEIYYDNENDTSNHDDDDFTSCDIHDDVDFLYSQLNELL